MPRLLNYTAIGDTVNLAKRLEESSEPGDIYMSAATYAALNPEALDEAWDRIIALGSRKLKGFTTAFDVFRIQGVQPNSREVQLSGTWRLDALNVR